MKQKRQIKGNPQKLVDARLEKIKSLHDVVATRDDLIVRLRTQTERLKLENAELLAGNIETHNANLVLQHEVACLRTVVNSGVETLQEVQNKLRKSLQERSQ